MMSSLQSVDATEQQQQQVFYNIFPVPAMITHTSWTLCVGYSKKQWDMLTHKRDHCAPWYLRSVFSIYCQPECLHFYL